MDLASLYSPQLGRIFSKSTVGNVYIIKLRNPGPLGQVREDRLCHRSKLFLVSGFRCQVSVNTESWIMSTHRLETEGRPLWKIGHFVSDGGSGSNSIADTWHPKPETLFLLINVTMHITPPGWTKAGPSGPGSLLSTLVLIAISIESSIQPQFLFKLPI